MRKFLIFLFLFPLLLTSCGGRGAAKGEGNATAGEVDSLLYARNLSLERFIIGSNSSNNSDSSDIISAGFQLESRPGSRHIYIATVRNPWDTAKTLQRYILIPRGMEIPEGLPKGAVVRVPVEKALVYSSLHAGLIDDLGAAKGIGGVCNGRFITDPGLRERIKQGEVTDCGEGMNPDMEKIIHLHPDLIMLSPFENNDRYGKVAQMGIPVIECADYMETSALGQAEWMKFYGLLFGKGEEARERFDSIAGRYNDFKAEAARREYHPKVIMDQVYGQSWSVPGGESTMGRLIEDAGGVNPFARYKQSGGVPLAPEKVLAEAGDADIWLVRYNQGSEKSLQELSRDAAVNSQFKAFKLKNVYGCNTGQIPFFDETPFHPDMLLEELMKLFEKPDGDPHGLRYFKRME